MTEGDPFAALGLAAREDVSDDDVRAAWRRIAAAVVTLAFLAAGWSPGTAGVLTGAVTWLTATLWRERRGWLGRWSLTVLFRQGERRPRREALKEGFCPRIRREVL